ncbi:MAG: cell division topological specificity factor MinE [Deltaproteobacteria bacterium]|nr:cell division topological specificity factor MinE [Deltaproteobacteria bacterium]
MSILDYFFRPRKPSAALAKERLQIIVAHERSMRGMPDFLPRLQREILDVIARYVQVEKDQVKVSFDRNDEREVLELNIVLPEVWGTGG